METKSPTLLRIKEFRHQCLRDLLAQCTVEQIEVFNLMYGSVDSIREVNIDWVIQQCEEAIASNEERPEEKVEVKP